MVFIVSGSRSESESENKEKRPVPLKRVTIGKRELQPLNLRGADFT